MGSIKDETSEYGRRFVDRAGTDTVGFALINLCLCSAVVVMQDYGVAAFVLDQRACAIHQNSSLCAQDNVDQVLMERYFAHKARIGKGGHHF